ncbi:myelin proteolipid protein [Dictyocaulus viviparus]|uniref:Myelin proteolipid protein n=1 Tax=Dictyocaulus viviparus TaxID=29172 RepID=A0A0D8XLD9_DICVI|nr:myelin proteolipid protein [Dictyocaulus viviparus]
MSSSLILLSCRRTVDDRYLQVWSIRLTNFNFLLLSILQYFSFLLDMGSVFNISGICLPFLFGKANKLSKKINIRDDSIYGVVLDAPPRRVKPPEFNNKRIPVIYHPKDGCFNRTPYASLMATFLCFIGVILFAIMMTWGFNATIEQMRRSSELRDIPLLDKVDVFLLHVQVFLMVIAVFMSLFVLLFLIIGFSATGATREELYSRGSAKYGGKCVCATAIAWCLTLIICWLFIMSMCSVLCYAYFVHGNLCYNIKSFTDNDCTDFLVFIPLVRSYSDPNLRLCGADAQQFCVLSTTAISWYIVSWIASCLVILGLALFLAIMATNYTRVGNASRYVELRDLALEVSSDDLSPHSKTGTRVVDVKQTIEQLKSVTDNISSIIQVVGSVSSPATKYIGEILEQSAAALEELYTLSGSIIANTNAVRDNLKHINSILVQLDALWPNIERAVEFVAQKRLYYLVLTRAARRIRQEADSDVVLQNSYSTNTFLNTDTHTDSDSDMPEEISSKGVTDIKLNAKCDQSFSIFEQLQEKNGDSEREKLEKTSFMKRKRVRKVDRGEFRVKKKKAEFTILTLADGVQKSLEPTVNFRDELLKARTSGKREKVANAALMRAKWI